LSSRASLPLALLFPLPWQAWWRCDAVRTSLRRAWTGRSSWFRARFVHSWRRGSRY
jgi:hypothetical protein